MTKLEHLKCLTCIYYRRPCEGTNLHPHKGRPRCDRCAKKGKDGKSGSRDCVWANESLGVDTYEDAKQVYKMIENKKNTVAGKKERHAGPRRTKLELAMADA